MAKSRALYQEAKVVDLMGKILTGDVVEIKPTLNLSSKAGFTYTDTEKFLGIAPELVAQVLESLAGENILTKKFSDKIYLCPYCQSANLRPSLRCSKCGSGYIEKARILEHFSCGYSGAEQEFIGTGKYVCPRCKRELRFLGTDYRSLGLKYICGNCKEVFTDPVFKWQCLGCLLLFAENEAKEIPLYTYYLNESQRQWLEFELKPKTRFISYLRNAGYDVAEDASVMGRSGAEHIFDVLARKDDDLCNHILAIDITILEPEKEVGLDKVFSFDDKAYDSGIHDKVFIVADGLGNEAAHFADRQRIKILSAKDLEKLLNSVKVAPAKKASAEPFHFENKSQLVRRLRDANYTVKEKAKIWGRSGVEYEMDILSEWDDGIIKHSLAVGVLTAPAEVSLESVALFDTKAYDIGIHDKVLLVAPKLSREAAQFAQRQKIKVIETNDATRLA